MFLINPFWYKAPLPSGLGYRYGYEFDGVDEYIDLGNVLTFDRNNAFSFSFWVKFSSLAQSGAVIAKSLSSGTYQGVLINLVSSRIKFSINDGLGGPSDAMRVSSSVLAPNTWYHFAVSYDGSSLRSGMNIYKNGVLDRNADLLTSISGNINASTSFNIAGRNNTTSYNVLGRIDDIQFYDFELNSTQVSDIYNSGYVTAPTAGPIHHWKLGEEDTFSTNWTVKDSVGSLDGTSVNMEEVDRKLGVAYSLEFDGVDERVDFGEVNNQDGSSAFSISCWIKTNTTSGFHSIVSKLSGSSPFNGYEVQQNSNKIRFFIIDQNGNRLQANSTNTLSTNTWYNITFTYDGSKDISGCNLYINNGLETLTNTTNTFTGSADSTGIDFDIGSGQGSSYYWNGNIMEVSLYDTELSAADVALLFNETGTGNGVPIDPRNVGLSPTFYCPMVGASDSYDGTNWTITDEIAGNNGTSVNMEEADKTSETP